ncbi:hypothetical protein ACTWQB_00515 [Piscibacillus sp. B03]|uniref:hypothetical protein n=1 Tax=Piscibacillus sp. B03 TaxID=3457430 RepID=UPI003FCC9556
MLTLKINTIEQSASWVKRHARPLEVARWEYEFEEGSQQNVMNYLSAFQNEDGGFAHGLEPDFWVPHSNAMATWAAGRILIELDARADHEIVQKMVTYLINTSQKSGMWASVIPENSDYPHAPWWGYSEDAQNNWMFNPSVELAAMLIHWSDEEDEAWQVGWQSVSKACERLMAAEEMDFHEVSNFKQMTSLLDLHKKVFKNQTGHDYNVVLEKVKSLILHSVEQDPTKWGTSYQPFPLDFIDGPNDPLVGEFETLIDQNLDFYINEMSDEGIWDISWEWGTYPNEFAISRRYWQGILTVDRYKLLNRFERV